MVRPENMCSSNIIWMYINTYIDEMTINDKSGHEIEGERGMLH